MTKAEEGKRWERGNQTELLPSRSVQRGGGEAWIWNAQIAVFGFICPKNQFVRKWWLVLVQNSAFREWVLHNLSSGLVDFSDWKEGLCSGRKWQAVKAGLKNPLKNVLLVVLQKQVKGKKNFQVQGWLGVQGKLTGGFEIHAAWH